MQSHFNHRISSNVFLILISFAIACVIWMIAKGNDRGQQRFRATILLANVPGNVVARPRLPSVEVSAGYPQSLQIYMSNSAFQAVVDWNDQTDTRWCGVGDFADSPPLPIKEIRPVGSLDENIRDRISREVAFTAIQPSKVSIEGKFITRPASLFIPTKGRPAEGFQLAGPIQPTIKRTILLTASADRFRDLNAADRKSVV